MKLDQSINQMYVKPLVVIIHK